MSTSSTKQLVDFLKSEKAQASLRQLDEQLAKGTDDTVVGSPRERLEGRRQMDQLLEDKWGMDKPPAALEHFQDSVIQHKKYLAQEPDAHFLNRKKPHPEFKERPWEVYELGMGNNAGKALNQGMPLSSNEVLQHIERLEIDPHRTIIRPSNKTEPWIKIKGHNTFKDPVQKRLSKLYETTITGKEPASAHDLHRDKKPHELNQEELKLLRY